MLDDRVGSDTDLIANLIRFSDEHRVPGLKLVADEIAGIDHGMRTDAGRSADASFQSAGRQIARRRADNNVFTNLTVCSQDDIGMDDVRNSHGFLPEDSGTSVNE